MALTANRKEGPFSIEITAPPDAWGQGIGGATIEQHYYDHPYPHVALLVQEIKRFTDTQGHVIRIEDESWSYDEVTRAPRQHVKTVSAYCWLPGVSNKWDLRVVQQETTDYLVKGWYIGGETSRRTSRAGWVIYDMRPQQITLTQAEIDALHAAGIAAPGEAVSEAYPIATETKLLPASGRVWSAAGQDASIVQKATAPQVALWRDPFEVEEIRVEEDFQKIVTTTWRKNFLQPGPPTIDRKESLKNPNSVRIQVPILPPAISGTGAHLEIKGGGVEVKRLDQWFREHIEHARPEKYRVYRKTIVDISPAATGDPNGIWATPPAYVPRGIGPIERTGATDMAGAPANPLPGATSYTEPENPTPPTPDMWSLVVEVDNAVADPTAEGKATVTDTSAVAGATYEYYATAVLGVDESPESNHLQWACAASGSSSSGIAVTVVAHDDGSLEIDASAPVVPDVPSTYGDARIIKAVVAFTAPPGGGWSSGLITDPATYGQEVGLRQFQRFGNRYQVTVALTTPLLAVERGQRVTIPQVLWKTYGNGLQISSGLLSEDLILDGFGFTIARDRDTWRVDPGTLQLVTP